VYEEPGKFFVTRHAEFFALRRGSLDGNVNLTRRHVLLGKEFALGVRLVATILMVATIPMVAIDEGEG
jgi:hypothetical protein